MFFKKRLQLPRFHVLFLSDAAFTLEGLFIQNETAAWRRSRRNGLNKTN